MIHTILLTAKITEEAYYKLLKKLRRNTQDKNTVFYYYSKYGLREVRLFAKEKYNQYFIQLIINPRVITEQADSVLTSSREHIEALPEAFDSLLHSKFPGIQFPLFEDWQCTRIDYAVDVSTEHKDEYIKLFNKGDSPFWFDDKCKEGSLYRKSKSVRVNFYDKAHELKNNNRVDDAADTEIVKDIIRIEVQCHKSKTSYMKRKFEFKDKSILNYLDQELSQETILNYYDRVIGSGDYYKLPKAEKIINESSYSTREKNAIVKTMKLIAQARSITNAREQFQEGVVLKNTEIFLKGTKATFNEHIKKIRALGINPVTIPREWDINFLKNIKEMLVKV